jgi:hypothetical protein
VEFSVALPAVPLGGAAERRLDRRPASRSWLQIDFLESLKLELKRVGLRAGGITLCANGVDFGG